MICYLYPKPIFLLFSNDVPTLLYYAQIPATVIALLLGFYVFWNGRNLLLNRLLFLITILFSLWTFTTHIVWAGNDGGLFAFVWPFYDLILSFIVIFCIYFIYVFLTKEDVRLRLKIIFLALLAPVLFLATTNLNISGFNITNCDAFDFEWFPFKLYCILLGVLAIVWIFVLLIRRYRIATPDFKKQIVLMGTGMELFLFLFFIWTNLTYYLTDIGVLTDSRLELYGMIGMVIFIIFISILIVRFKAFNGKLFATQAFVVALNILIVSQFFFIKATTSLVLNAITLVLCFFISILLVKSVKKEIEQKEKLQVLDLQLENANEKLKSLDKLKTEFLSLASHQLRSPLTAIKGYTSMLLDGDYGQIGDKQKEAIDRVLQSSKHLTVVVEDLLDVAKIEQGGMQYIMETFDFEKTARDLETDLSITAKKKGLDFSFENDNKMPYLVNGDMEKLRQVILNLTDNSIKYTKEGSIKIKLTKDEEKKKIRLVISDTGIGIAPEIKDTLFQKFARGDGGKMNTTGTGLGLYLAKQIVEAHKGLVWAESMGIGKGSTFFVELDVA